MTDGNTSLVLGFCKCDKCGFEKFYWNTRFVCQNCGNTTYVKSQWEDELLYGEEGKPNEEKRTGIHGYDGIDDIFLVDDFSIS